MSVFYIGITDTDWYSLIKEDYKNGTGGQYVNFWTPGTKEFKALKPGGLFLFKLHNRINANEHGEIVGGGYFSHYEKMAISDAWEKYGRGNGRSSLISMEQSIYEIKEKNDLQLQGDIGCIVLENIFIFDECIAEPSDWKKNTVRGKKYDTNTEIGFELWSKVENLISKIDQDKSFIPLEGRERDALIKARVNQNVFKERLLERYNSCCLCKVSNTSLLRASHIKPWKDCLPEEKLDVDNGFLLCPNHDALFDSGFISFGDDGSIIISEELSYIDAIFTNVDKSMKISLTEKNREYLEFHRSNVFLKNNNKDL